MYYIVTSMLVLLERNIKYLLLLQLHSSMKPCLIIFINDFGNMKVKENFK